MCYLQVSELGLRLLDLATEVKQFVILLLDLRLQGSVVTPRLLVSGYET